MGLHFCIIHYNTPIITTCLIGSIRKFHPDADITIFDNSDKQPFDKTLFEDIEYLDNTQQQLIHFDEYISKFTDTVESSRKINNFGSAKHAMSVEYLCNTFNNPFILLDSDVLLKRQVSCIYDENCICVSDIINCVYANKVKKPRIAPFITMINPALMHRYNIHFFDANRIDGLTKAGHYNDTGSSFFEDISMNIPQYFKKIRYTDFVEHYGKGSYSGNIDNAKHWLFIHKNLWK